MVRGIQKEEFCVMCGKRNPPNNNQRKKTCSKPCARRYGIITNKIRTYYLNRVNTGQYMKKLGEGKIK